MEMKALTLGELIDKVGEYSNHFAEKEEVRTLGFDTPIRICSYRGYYYHLAIICGPKDKGTTFKEFHDMLKGCVGKTFEGYKGGDYVATLDKKVYVVGSPDQCSNFVVTDFTLDYSNFSLITHDETLIDAGYYDQFKEPNND